MNDETKTIIAYIVIIALIGFLSSGIDFLIFKIKADYTTKQIINTIETGDDKDEH